MHPSPHGKAILALPVQPCSLAGFVLQQMQPSVDTTPCPSAVFTVGHDLNPFQAVRDSDQQDRSWGAQMS